MKKRTLAVKSTPVVSKIYAEDLAYYQPKPGVLSPGWRGVSERLTRFAADKILRGACKRVGLVGVSTHSFIRTD